ncbi:MAG TPA: ATP-dependent zinc metalloprotease FtsH, partial [Acidimicrobiia bacterium]|nr:ATP-dependent zinc metalloprotease FtsH [Acidimicrobiia bacterium]
MSRRPTDLDPDTNDERPAAGRSEPGEPRSDAPAPPPPPYSPPAPPRSEPPAPPEHFRPVGNGAPPERPSPPRPPAERKPPGGGTSASLRWVPWVVLALVAAAFLVSSLAGSSSSKADLTYSQFEQQVQDGNVKKVEFNKSTGSINGTFESAQNGKTEFTSSGPKDDLPQSMLTLLKKQDVDLQYTDTSSNIWGDILIYALPFVLIIGFLVWMSRRAQGQMGAVMNIGRSRAKVYNTEKPQTTFEDVAGYGPVKQEIAEVVDFLKNPGKFKEIGARIPKGVLLVGPPGTGKTLIARAVAGEAGVPFVSVTGSDFMEMFVGVGAARVRDLFQTARKQAPAIIFVDEIDSIGRKRGAGLGGGHDEREQTLNQMLAEMDGFEATEGIVMMAATNRPDVLDPALLRPGRFDRQIMVPLPTQDERVKILEVHFRDKKIADDVDVDVVARGTPGMSGADLSNLVNEAALFAVRRGEHSVYAEDFDAARDRVLMGLKRESMALTEEEKEVVAYHEGGHAVLAYVLEHADPVHKVTILPT